MGWVCSALGWVLLAAGLGVLAWALLWDRAGWRGRAVLRCRKCWYDLTGVGGEASAGSPVVCSECGRKHASRRAMRRTRRRWGWVVVGVVVIGSGYVAGIWPRVRADVRTQGWLVVVPTPVLVGAVALLDDEPVSAGRRFDERDMPIPVRKMPHQDRVADAVVTRLSDSGSTSRVDRWLFMRQARRADAAVLTDSTAVRGRLFGGVLRAWSAQGRLSADEERWVRSVVHIEWESPRALPQMSAAHVRVTTFRRLVNDRPVRVRVHDRVYEVRAASGGRAQFQPVGLRDGERSDGQVRIADAVRWANNLSTQPVESVPFRGVVFEGDAVADIWWPVARFEHTVPVGIGTDPTVERVQDDPQIAAWLDGLRGVLRWERGPGSIRAWPVGVEIAFPEEADAEWPAGFTFGGGVFLEVLWSGRTGYEVLASAGASWWALRDERDRRGLRVIEGRGEWMAFDGGTPRWGERLMAWPGDGERLEEARLVIEHLDAGFGRMFGPYWDLEAERVWQRRVRVKLTDDQRERLERWMTDWRE